MLGYFFLLFTIIPLIELALLIKLGTVFGVGNTIGLVILTGLLGAVLLKAQGFRILRRIDGELRQGLVPSDALLDGFLVFCGGILLITPGILTDVMGFFLLIPAGRQLLKYWIRQRIKSAFDEGRTIRIASFYRDDL